MKVNVYDFDGTIYDGDSSIDFFIYVLMKNPKILFMLPKIVYSFFKYMIKMISKDRFKEIFFQSIIKIKLVDKHIENFWNIKEKKIKEWYLEQKKEDDIIISASPYFLLKPICEKIGINNLIATNIDKQTGKMIGKNCYGEEKVHRFFNKYKNIKIKAFYTDSLSDKPMLDLAETGYIVKGNKIIPYDKKR